MSVKKCFNFDVSQLIKRLLCQYCVNKWRQIQRLPLYLRNNRISRWIYNCSCFIISSLFKNTFMFFSPNTNNWCIQNFWQVMKSYSFFVSHTSFYWLFLLFFCLCSSLTKTREQYYQMASITSAAEFKQGLSNSHKSTVDWMQVMFAFLYNETSNSVVPLKVCVPLILTWKETVIKSNKERKWWGRKCELLFYWFKSKPPKN